MIEAVVCNSCGAPLQIPAQAHFVTCNHCHTHLAVKRSESTTFTEAIDRLVETTQSLNEQVQQLQRQNQLAELDREWSEKQQSLMVSDKEGRRQVPTTTMALTIGGFGIVGGIVAMGMASSIVGSSPLGGMSLFPVFGLIFIALAVISAVHIHHKATNYELAAKRYRQRRSEIANGPRKP